MKRNGRDFRKFEEIACTTQADCEKIKKHLRLAFCNIDLNIRIIYSYADKYRMYISVNKFEYELLRHYLLNAKIENVKFWNY